MEVYKFIILCKFYYIFIIIINNRFPAIDINNIKVIKKLSN